MERREFLKHGASAGALLTISFMVPNQMLAKLSGNKMPFSPNAYLSFFANGIVKLVSPKTEMGQGTHTAIAMMVAEELDLDMHKLRVVDALVEPPFDANDGFMMITGGSSGVTTSYEIIRNMAASVRDLFIRAAAKKSGIRAGILITKDGAVYHGRKKLYKYEELADIAKTLKFRQVKYKSNKDFKVIKKPNSRLIHERIEKATGKAKYGIDTTFEGMKYAVLVRPKIMGSKISSYDDSEAMKVNGVIKVKKITDDKLAVIADSTYIAMEGAKKVKVKYKDTEFAQYDTQKIYDKFKSIEESKKDQANALKKGKDESEIKNLKVKEYEFWFPYLAHAALEPLNCTVVYRDGKCHIYTSTQMPPFHLNAAAKAIDYKRSDVVIHPTLLGGAFGRKGEPTGEFVVEGALVAKDEKYPIKMMYTREDDMKGRYYRPMQYYKTKLGFSNNKLEYFYVAIAGQQITKGTFIEGMMIDKKGVEDLQVEGLNDFNYEVDNVSVNVTAVNDIPIPTLWWRSVGHTHTAFVRESMIDIAAHEEGIDPLEYRIKLLKHEPRFVAILKKLKSMSGYKSGYRHYGVAIARSFGSITGEIVKIKKVGKKIVVDKVWCVVDCGTAVNPQNVANQVRGGVVFGLTAALYGKVDVKDGEIVQNNYYDYKMLRINQMPKIEVAIIDSGAKMGGIGEPAVPPLAPALANAIYNLEKKRITKLPLMDHMDV